MAERESRMVGSASSSSLLPVKEVNTRLGNLRELYAYTAVASPAVARMSEYCSGAYPLPMIQMKLDGMVGVDPESWNENAMSFALAACGSLGGTLDGSPGSYAERG